MSSRLGSYEEGEREGFGTKGKKKGRSRTSRRRKSEMSVRGREYECRHGPFAQGKLFRPGVEQGEKQEGNVNGRMKGEEKKSEGVYAY